MMPWDASARGPRGPMPRRRAATTRSLRGWNEWHASSEGAGFCRLDRRRRGGGRPAGCPGWRGAVVVVMVVVVVVVVARWVLAAARGCVQAAGRRARTLPARCECQPRQICLPLAVTLARRRRLPMAVAPVRCVLGGSFAALHRAAPPATVPLASARGAPAANLVPAPLHLAQRFCGWLWLWLERRCGRQRQPEHGRRRRRRRRSRHLCRHLHGRHLHGGVVVFGRRPSGRGDGGGLCEKGRWDGVVEIERQRPHV